MDSPTVGSRLREARELVSDLSQRELDRIAGRPEGQCGMIESRGQKTLDPSVATAYSHALGIARVWLVLGEGDAPVPAKVRATVAAARAGTAIPEAESPKRPSGTFAQVSADALPTATAIYDSAKATG